MFAFPEAKQLCYTANTYLRLGGPQHARLAQRHAQQAVAGYEQPPPPRRRVGELSLARLDLAAALLAQGSLHGAGEQVASVVTATAGRRTHSVTNRLREFTAALDHPTWHAVPEAAALRRQVAAYCTAIPAVALPSGLPVHDQQRP